jgi:hypothetical protein
MRKYVYVLLGIIVLLHGATFADEAATTPDPKPVWRGSYGTQPQEILDRVVREANVGDRIQDTRLDGISATAQQAYDSRFKISNTLNSFRVLIWPYLQQFMFFGLSLATILIIISWFQLVTSAQSGMDTKKALERIQNIALGIFILTGVYIILRIFLALIAYML